MLVFKLIPICIAQNSIYIGWLLVIATTQLYFYIQGLMYFPQLSKLFCWFSCEIFTLEIFTCAWCGWIHYSKFIFIWGFIPFSFLKLFYSKCPEFCILLLRKQNMNLKLEIGCLGFFYSYFYNVKNILHGFGF